MAVCRLYRSMNAPSYFDWDELFASSEDQASILNAMSIDVQMNYHNYRMPNVYYVIADCLEAF